MGEVLEVEVDDDFGASPGGDRPREVPAWGLPVAVALVGLLAFAVVVVVLLPALMRSGQSQRQVRRPATAGSQAPVVDERVRAAGEAMAAWGRFAGNGDLKELANTFDQDGPQYRQLAEEAAEVAETQRGSLPYEVTLRRPRVVERRRDVAVAADVIWSRPGEPRRVYRWVVILRDNGGRLRLWTTQDGDRPTETVAGLLRRIPVAQHPAFLVLLALGFGVGAATDRRVHGPTPSNGYDWALAATVVVTMPTVFVPELALPGPDPLWAIAGLGVLWAGLGLRAWAQAVLGPRYRGDLAVADDQVVVEAGPYRWIRHPGYAGVLAYCLGLGLALGAWPPLVGGTAVLAAAFRSRVKREEGILFVRLAHYRNYARRVPRRLVPGLW